jgi:hypothetical protein
VDLYQKPRGFNLLQLLPQHLKTSSSEDILKMERAMQNANLRHDLPSPGNMPPKHSFASLSSEDILSRASSIGISLGKNKKEALEAAVSIKEVDVNRTLMILKKTVEFSLDKEEG